MSFFRSPMQLSSGEIFLCKGDPSDALYLLLVDTLWLDEAEVYLKR